MDLTFFEYVIRHLLQPEFMARVFVLIYCIFWGKFIRDVLDTISLVPKKNSVNEVHTGPDLQADEPSVSKKKEPSDKCKSEVINVTKKSRGPELKSDISLRDYEFAKEKLKNYKMDLARTNRALTKAKEELSAYKDMWIEPKRQTSPKCIAEKVENDLKINEDPDVFVENDQVLIEPDKIPIASILSADTTPSNTENQLAEASNAEVLNGQVVRTELYEQERADYTAKIERLKQECDDAKTKLRKIDELCETALLITTQAKNKFAADAAFAKRWAEKELRNKKMARFGTAKTPQSNNPELPKIVKNSEAVVGPSTTELEKAIPLPVSKQIRILINTVPVDMAIDTRCRFSCINKSLWQKMGEPELLPIRFDEWFGNQVSRRGLTDVLRGKKIKYKLDFMDVMGYFIARAKVGKKDHSCPLLVFDKPGIPNFIGKSWFQTLDLAGVNAFRIEEPEGFSKKEHYTPKAKLTSPKENFGLVAKLNFLWNYKFKKKTNKGKTKQKHKRN